VEDSLASYIAQGYEKATDVLPADVDAAATAWAYYRSFTTAADLLALMPSAASLTGLGSIGVSATSVKYFYEQATKWLNIFGALTPGPDLGQRTPIQGSASVPNRYRW
jgi:hypothetical protein